MEIKPERLAELGKMIDELEDFTTNNADNIPGWYADYVEMWIGKMRHFLEEPRYQHDCDSCVFLGRFEQYDLYVCCQTGEFASKIPEVANTVIARWSSDGPDYSSGIEFRDYKSNLGEAFRRAVDRGLLVESDYRKQVRCRCGVLRADNNDEPCIICELEGKP